MLTAGEIAELLSSGYELRGLELKGPGLRTDAHLFAKVARAALGMGNLRDGGHIVIGIDDKDIASMLPGLDPHELTSWLAFDDVSRKLAQYADPPIQFEIAPAVLPNGATVAAVQVFEFADLPHICAKDFPGVLRHGALYVRPRKVPETSEVASSVEMREVLELATEKALRSYITTADRAGLELSVAGSDRRRRSRDTEAYEVQRRGAWE